MSLGLLVLALLSMQALIGGARIVFSAPVYAVLAVAALLFSFSNSRTIGMFRPSCIIATLGVAAWIIGRAFFSPVGYLARNDFLMVLGGLVVYLVTVVWLDSPRKRLSVAVFLILAALVHVAVGAVQFKQNDNFMPISWLMRPNYFWRASGFYVCPNHLAGLLEVVGILAFSLACWSGVRVIFRVAAGYAAILCFAGVAITGSRGGYLSLLFGLAVFASLSLVVSYRLRRGGFWVMLSTILVGAAIFVGTALFFMTRSSTLQARLGEIYDPTNMRLLMWQAALTQFELQPFIGTGSGTYLYYGRLFRSASVQNDPMHVHNDYLELLAEYGVIGAALFSVFVILHLLGGMAGLKKIVNEQMPPGAPARSDELALLIGALSGIGALVVHSVVDFNLHIPANTLVVAFLFGILSRPVEVLGTSAVRAAWLRWFIVVPAGALLGFSLRYFPGEYFAEKARVALREDRNEDAVAFAQRGLQYEKKNPNLFGYLGEAKHFLTRDTADIATRRALHEEAVEAYREGLQLFPRDTGLLLKLAQTYSLLERFQEADDVFHRVFECDPNFGLPYAYYGLHWELQRRIRTAEHYFRKAQSMGEADISPNGLRRIEQLKNSPVGQALMSAFPESDLEPPPHTPPTQPQ